jgi:hypothetical protein
MRALVGLSFLLAFLLIDAPEGAQAGQGTGAGSSWAKAIINKQNRERKEAQKPQAPPKAQKAAGRAGGSDPQRAKPLPTGGGGFEVSASTGGGGLDYDVSRRADAPGAVIKAAAQ